MGPSEGLHCRTAWAAAGQLELIGKGRRVHIVGNIIISPISYSASHKLYEPTRGHFISAH